MINVETNYFCHYLCCFVAKSAISAVLPWNLFHRNLRAFVWRKIYSEIVLVEKKGQICGMIARCFYGPCWPHPLGWQNTRFLDCFPPQGPPGYEGHIFPAHEFYSNFVVGLLFGTLVAVKAWLWGFGARHILIAKCFGECGVYPFQRHREEITAKIFSFTILHHNEGKSHRRQVMWKFTLKEDCITCEQFWK